MIFRRYPTATIVDTDIGGGVDPTTIEGDARSDIVSPRVAVPAATAVNDGD